LEEKKVAIAKRGEVKSPASTAAVEEDPSYSTPDSSFSVS
jgi:hypothetical protein